jgi:hypothetical protein
MSERDIHGFWQQEECHSTSPDEFETQDGIVVMRARLNLSVNPLEQQSINHNCSHALISTKK